MVLYQLLITVIRSWYFADVAWNSPKRDLNSSWIFQCCYDSELNFYDSLFSLNYSSRICFSSFRTKFTLSRASVFNLSDIYRKLMFSFCKLSTNFLYYLIYCYNFLFLYVCSYTCEFAFSNFFSESFNEYFSLMFSR